MSSADDDLEILRSALTVLERRAADVDWLERLDVEVLQGLLASAVSLYARRVDSSGFVEPFGAATPTPTAVCVAASVMLEAVSVEVFELAMWKTWGSAVDGDT